MKNRWHKIVVLAAFACLTATAPSWADRSITHVSPWGFVQNSKKKNMAGLEGKLCLTAYFKKGGNEEKCLEITANKYGQFWVAFSFTAWYSGSTSSRDSFNPPANFSAAWKTDGSDGEIACGVDFWHETLVSTEWDQQYFNVFTQPVNIKCHLP